MLLEVVVAVVVVAQIMLGCQVGLAVAVDLLQEMVQDTFIQDQHNRVIQAAQGLPLHNMVVVVVAELPVLVQLEPHQQAVQAALDILGHLQAIYTQAVAVAD
jgi:hypothetical protein